jgi:hypothetical protein
VSKLGLEVLEVFAEAQSSWRDSPGYRKYSLLGLRIMGAYENPPTPEQKKRWRDANKDLQAVYARRSYARKNGLPVPPIKLVKVEIFWEGQSFWYAEPNCDQRLGGPFETMHKAWKHADKAKIEVIDFTKTRGNRGPK